MPNHDLKPSPQLTSDWQSAKYPHGVTRGHTLLAMTGTLFGLCLIVVVGRVGVRISRKSLGTDDALMIAAMILCAGVDAGLYLAFLRYGFNRHAWDLTESIVISARKVGFAIEAVNMACASLTKISILCFCKRLAGGTYKSSMYNLVVQGSIVFVATALAVFTLTLFLSCYPLEAFWLQFSPSWLSQHKFACFDEFDHLISSASVGVAEDFIVFGVPAALLWRLRITRKKKIALACLLGLGFFPCVAGILRIVYTIKVYNGYDATWNAYPAYICLVIETHLAILCASVPALNSSATNLVRHVRKNSNWSVLKNRGRNGSISGRNDAETDLEIQEINQPGGHFAPPPPPPPPKDAKPANMEAAVAGAFVTSGLAMNPPSPEAGMELRSAYFREPQTLAHVVLLNRSTPSVGGFSGVVSDMPTVHENEEIRPFIPARTRWNNQTIDEEVTALPAPTRGWR